MAKRTAKKSRTTGRKKTTRKTTTRTATSGGKIPKADKVRTKSEVYRTIAENTDLTRAQVAQVFDVMGEMMRKDLAKTGPEIFNVAGLMKVTVQRKPATKARKGINPFTGEETMFKAKPARRVVKVRPLKSLKEMV